MHCGVKLQVERPYHQWSCAPSLINVVLCGHAQVLALLLIISMLLQLQKSSLLSMGAKVGVQSSEQNMVGF